MRTCRATFRLTDKQCRAPPNPTHKQQGHGSRAYSHEKRQESENTPPSAVLPRREPQSTYGTHTPLAVSDAMWRAVRLARAARASGSGSSGSSGSGGGDGGNSSATAVALANGDAYHARCRYHNCYAMLSYRYRDIAAADLHRPRRWRRQGRHRKIRTRWRRRRRRRQAPTDKVLSG